MDANLAKFRGGQHQEEAKDFYQVHLSFLGDIECPVCDKLNSTTKIPLPSGGTAGAAPIAAHVVDEGEIGTPRT